MNISMMYNGNIMTLIRIMAALDTVQGLNHQATKNNMTIIET